MRTWFPYVLVTAAALNEDDRDTVSGLKSGGNLLPQGVITPWSDDISLPPANWTGCDGSGATRDLRDRFIMYADIISGPNIGDTGGATSFTVPAHDDHVLVTPAHRAHTFYPSAHQVNSAFSGFNNGSFGGNNFGTAGGHGGNILGDHPHAGAAIDSTVHAHAPLSLLPPYRAHAFIQKTTTPAVADGRTWVSGENPSAATLNAEWRDIPNNIKASTVPLGMMGYWTGNLVDLPSGWVECTGALGTMDMRGRFGVGQGATYGVGDSGGAVQGTLSPHASHAVTQPSPHADHGVLQGGDHPLLGPTDATGAVNGSDGAGFPGGFPQHIWGVDGHPAHSGFGLNAHGAHGPISLMPPYRSYYVVQFVSAPVYTTARTWSTGDVVSAPEMNTYVRDNFTSLLARVWPVGMTLLWGGDIHAIPAGFTLENAVVGGFALGVDDITHMVNEVNSTPPFRTWPDHPAHNISQPSNHANHAIGQPGSHNLDQVYFSSDPAFFSYIRDGGHNFQLDIGGPHHVPHAFTVDAGAVHSHHATSLLWPPYLALAYIQRTS